MLRRSSVRAPIPRRALGQVAASLDAPTSMLSHVPELFSEMVALGSSPRTVARLLREARIGPGSRIIDLGCGKGAVAVHVARMLGCRVVGIDAFQPFIAAAISLASARGVSDRCRFRLADLHSLRPAARFDAAIMLGVLPLEQAAPLLRRWVRRRGVYVIDDAFREGDATDPSLSAVPTRVQARAIIIRSGDTILRELVPAPRDIKRQNARIYSAIARAARRLARQDPTLAPALRRYLAAQRRANTLLEGHLRGAIWLIRRTA
jgi:ubiquinone/menaquinone biosynthesis C-methylase UbiE